MIVRLVMMVRFRGDRERQKRKWEARLPCCGAATAKRGAATPQNNRFHRVFEALDATGLHTEPVVYDEEFQDEVRDQLLAVDGVLVWVDPLHEGKTRTALDALLRDVTAHGPWVSAHPDVILKMGVKQVVHRTKALSWGADTYMYASVESFREEFPARLRTASPRVLKQNRGNGGQGVWKVERIDPALAESGKVRVLHAQRGSMPEELPLSAFMTRCEAYLTPGGCIVDQPFQLRLPEGMIRCYMGADKVVGFGHQLIKALIPPPTRRAALSGGTARSSDHASCHGRAVSSAEKQNGGRMDASDDGGAWNRRRALADHLRRRLPLRSAHRVG
jgi:hypothetical protein